MIDLHLHTTASDGRCSPRELVERAAAAGLTVLAVADHDTVAAVGEVRALAGGRNIEAITGIEITAIESGRDVHMLGYFFDADSPELAAFLARQRASRLARIVTIGERLAELGMPVDLEPLVAAARRHASHSIGRPKIARMMVDAGYAADMRDAFDHWLVPGRPAFVPRAGAPPEEVIAILHRAGGMASLAHPGRTRIDVRIAALKEAGLDAIEVFHPDHDEPMVARYRQMARALDLLVTGGSDFHGAPSHGLEPGASTLPTPEWDRLFAAHHRHARP
jgi:predicted metal-dependent phosphoesterase TrpH